MKKIYTHITKQMGFSYASTLLLFVINPLLIVLLTRTLTVAEYGTYAVLAVTISVASVLLDLGLSQYILSKLAGAPARHRIPAFQSLFTFLMLFVLGIIAVVLLTPLEQLILNALRLTDYAAEFRIGTFIIVCTALVRLCTAYLMAQKRIIFVNIVTLVSQSFWVLLVLATYLATQRMSILTVTTCWFAGTVLTLLFSGWMMRREFSFAGRARTWQPSLVREGLLFSLPLLLFQAGSWAIEIGDRYMLNSMVNSETVATYTLAYSLLGVVNALATIIPLTFFPYFASAWNQRKDYHIYLNAMVKYSLVILLPALGGFLALREEIITLVSGTPYLPAVTVIPALLAYPLLSVYSYIAYQVLLLRNRTMLIGIAYCIGAIVNIVLNLLLIPRYQAVGAAFATVASYALVLAILAWDARSALRVDIRFLKAGRVLLAAAIMTAAVWFIDPLTAATKILTMAGGAGMYFLLVFMFGVLSPEELQLLRNVAPRPVRAFIPRRSP